MKGAKYWAIVKTIGDNMTVKNSKKEQKGKAMKIVKHRKHVYMFI